MESRQPPPINGGLNQQYPPEAAVPLESIFDLSEIAVNMPFRHYWLFWEALSSSP
jgi:hypothetical protein